MLVCTVDRGKRALHLANLRRCQDAVESSARSASCDFVPEAQELKKLRKQSIWKVLE